MILKNLEIIVREEKAKNNSLAYIRNALKEYLQVVVLSAIYTSPEFNKNLIFTGGTCLRRFFNLERLSEDLDFDFVSKLDVEKLKSHLEYFFTAKLKHPLKATLKQNNKQILLKFAMICRHSWPVNYTPFSHAGS